MSSPLSKKKKCLPASSPFSSVTSVTQVLTLTLAQEHGQSHPPESSRYLQCRRQSCLTHLRQNLAPQCLQIAQRQPQEKGKESKSTSNAKRMWVIIYTSPREKGLTLRNKRKYFSILYLKQTKKKTKIHICNHKGEK